MASTVCGWCGRFSNLSFVPGSATAIEVDPQTDTYFIMAAFTCNHCNRLVVAADEDRGPLGYDEVLYHFNHVDDSRIDWLPRRGIRRTFDDVPVHIAQAASEAYECLSIRANRAAIALARAVIEATAKDKGIVAGNLRAKIDEMQIRGLIRAHISDAAHEVRYLGNEMAHGDFVEPVAAEDCELALTLMSEVLVEVFQSPARVERAKRARLARQTSALE
jgi:hypothetical protein